MIRKTLLAALVLLVFAAGVTAAYLYFSIPNDIHAESLLRQAREDLKKGDREAARVSLQKVVKDYPRTDASAAATYALFEILEADRQRVKSLEDEVRILQKLFDNERKKLEAVNVRLTEVANRKPPAAPVVKAAPEPKPKPKPKPQPKPVKKKTTKRR